MKTRYIVIGAVVATVVAGVVVSCGGGSGGGSSVATYSVGGTVTGATGAITLKLNGANDTTPVAGAFTFTTMVATGATYNVQAVDANDRCTVTNGAGTMGTANVTNVSVTCAAQAAQKVIRSARLDGAQAGTGAAGTGFGGVVVDPGTRAITGGFTVSGLTGAPTMAHIHRGDNSIAVTINLASDNATGILLDGITLTLADYAELLAGTLYFNVHTVAFSGGEIRGQLNLQGGVVASTAALTGAQEVLPASSSTATGRGTLIVDAATLNVMSYVTHNVASATAAHIHTSPSGAGSNGNVILGFPTLQTNIDGAGTNLAYPPAGSQFTAQNLSDFSISYLYFNVHSNNNFCPAAPPTPCTGGEIRGDIVPQ